MLVVKIHKDDMITVGESIYFKVEKAKGKDYFTVKINAPKEFRIERVKKQKESTEAMPHNKGEVQC